MELMFTTSIILDDLEVNFPIRIPFMKATIEVHIIVMISFRPIYPVLPLFFTLNSSILY